MIVGLLTMLTFIAPRTRSGTRVEPIQWPLINVADNSGFRGLHQVRVRPRVFGFEKIQNLEEVGNFPGRIAAREITPDIIGFELKVRLRRGRARQADFALMPAVVELPNELVSLGLTWKASENWKIRSVAPDVIHGQPKPMCF